MNWMLGFIVKPVNEFYHRQIKKKNDHRYDWHVCIAWVRSQGLKCSKNEHKLKQDEKIQGEWIH